LSCIDPSIEAGGPLIARKPVEDRALCHDSWSRLIGHQKRFQTIGVIEMAVRKDRSMHRCLGIFAQLRRQAWRQTLGTGIDEHQPRLRFERGDPAEIRDEPSPPRYLDRSAGPIHPSFVGALPAVSLQELQEIPHPVLSLLRLQPT